MLGAGDELSEGTAETRAHARLMSQLPFGFNLSTDVEVNLDTGKIPK